MVFFLNFQRILSQQTNITCPLPVLLQISDMPGIWIQPEEFINAPVENKVIENTLYHEEWLEQQSH